MNEYTKGLQKAMERVSQMAVDLGQFGVIASSHAADLRNKSTAISDSLSVCRETSKMEKQRVIARAMLETLVLSEYDLVGRDALIKRGMKEMDDVAAKSNKEMKAMMDEAEQDIIQLCEKFEQEIERFAENSVVRKTGRTARERHAKKLRSVRVTQNQRVLQGRPCKP
jgi:uncharacterized protein (DUF4415 family)